MTLSIGHFQKRRRASRRAAWRSPAGADASDAIGASNSTERPLEPPDRSSSSRDAREVLAHEGSDDPSCCSKNRHARSTTAFKARLCDRLNARLVRRCRQLSRQRSSGRLEGISSMAATSDVPDDVSRRAREHPESKGVLLLMMPSVTDINGAGGVAARWKEYARELAHEGWTVELWTVDSSREETQIPRYHLPNFPGTLTDSPGPGFMLKLWRRLTRAPLVTTVVMSDLFSNVPVSMICKGTGTPLVYSIHTDIAQLDGVNIVPSSATFLQNTTARLAGAAVTTSPSFMALLNARGISACAAHYRPLPVDAVVEAANRATRAEVEAARDELTAGHPDRPLMTYVGRWSAEKRMHLLKACRPAGTTLALVGDGPMRDVVLQWHDPPRVVVLAGVRPRPALAVVYLATDWVVSASAFETFGNVPYEAAHCGTPALLQDAQGFVDQVDRTGRRGALLRFDAADGEAQTATAMDETAVLLGNPEIVRAAAEEQSHVGTSIHEVVSDVVETWKRGPPRQFRSLYLLLGLLWATALMLTLAALKVGMLAGMWAGIDFTTGMKNQRVSKRRWRMKKAPSSDDLGAIGGGGLEGFGDDGLGGEGNGDEASTTDEGGAWGTGRTNERGDGEACGAASTPRRPKLSVAADGSASPARRLNNSGGHVNGNDTSSIANGVTRLTMRRMKHATASTKSRRAHRAYVRM